MQRSPHQYSLCAVKLNVYDADDTEKSQRLAGDLEHFWRDVLPIMDSAVESSSLHNIARLSCVVGNLAKQQSSTAADGAVEPKVLVTGVA